MSVHTTNAVSSSILNIALNTGACSWAAVALAHPMGAMGGGLFGLVDAVAGHVLTRIVYPTLNVDDPQANQATRIVAFATVFFGGIAAAWGALALAGFSLVAADVVALGVMSLFTALALHFLAGCVADCITAPARR